MFLTKDPRSESTTGVRVEEARMAGGGTPATDEDLEVTVVNVVVNERSEPEDIAISGAASRNTVRIILPAKQQSQFQHDGKEEDMDRKTVSSLLSPHIRRSA